MVLVLLCLFYHGTVMRRTTPIRDLAAVVGEPVGRYLEKNLPPRTLVATASSGACTYFAPSLSFLDSLGLNNKHIGKRELGRDDLVTFWQQIAGHCKGDGDYILSRGPDLVVLGPASGFLGDVPTLWFLSDYELLHSREFQSRYRPYEFIVETKGIRSVHPELVLMEVEETFKEDHFPFIAYLRQDSPRVASLLRKGTPLKPPWWGK